VPSKIKSVTIVCVQGTNSYRVGNEYNGLPLHHIINDSLEVTDGYYCMYKGFTFNNEIVFETFNAPVDVEYEREEA